MSDYQWPDPGYGSGTPGAAPPPWYPPPPPPMPGPAPVRGKRKPWVLIGAAALVVILALGGLGTWFFLQYLHGPRPGVLPFTGLNEAYGVAVDGAGNVYVSDNGNNRVLELPKGGTSQVVLPFTGLADPTGVAVDGAGNLYVADMRNSRVLKLPKGATSQVVLPFTGLKAPLGVAVDGAGNVYVTDWSAQQVLKLQAGSLTQVVLPFTGLNNPGGVGVDTAGNIYVVDRVDPRVGVNGRLLKLPAGSTAQTVVSPPSAAQWTQCPSQPVAVDTAGSVYILCGDYRVYKLPTGSDRWTVLPFSDLGDDPGLAVDTANNLYITRGIQVLKLSAG
jgi:serine/threonine protein kinase, bacterial